MESTSASTKRTTGPHFIITVIITAMTKVMAGYDYGGDGGGG